MQDFKVLKTASSTEQLRRSLKSEDLDKFGEPFTPEFVYEAIRQDKRFENMKVNCHFLNYVLWICTDTICSVVINKMQRNS